MWPIALWYGGVMGIGLAALLVLWALAIIAFKQATGVFASGLLLVAVVLAAASTWAVTNATDLKQTSQLQTIHGPLVRLVAASVSSRGALEEVRAAAEPSAELTALQSKYDGHAASIENLLQAEWQYHRAGPWDEGALLYKLTWDLNAVRVHHARWEKRAEGLDCPAPPAVLDLPEAVSRLKDHLQNERVLAGAIAEQFEGFAVEAPESRTVSDAAVMKGIAVVCGGLALLCAAAVVLVWRKRSWLMIDVVVAVTAIVLVNLAGWLALGAGSDQERLRANLFAASATVSREAIELNQNANALMPVVRSGALQPRRTRETLTADYAEYLNSVRSLEQLVRIWDQFVLTGTLDTGLVASERVNTHDDLLDAIRSRTLTLYRQYAQIDRGVADLSCRAEWFPREGGSTMEDQLLALP